MDYATYDALPGTRWTQLARMAKSPLHYKTRSRLRTPSLGLGSTTHALLLGQPPVVVYPGKTRQGERFELFRDAQVPGTRIVLRREYDTALHMVAAIARRESVAALFRKDVLREHVIQWDEVIELPGHGPFVIPCKAQLDCYDPAANVLYEGKTAREVGEEAFGAQCSKYGYRYQCAFYSRGVSKRLNVPRPQVVLFGVENADEACDIGEYDVEPPMLERADAEIDRLLLRVAECELSGEWPGQCPVRRPLYVPPWEGAGPPIDFGDLPEGKDDDA